MKEITERKQFDRRVILYARILASAAAAIAFTVYYVKEPHKYVCIDYAAPFILCMFFTAVLVKCTPVIIGGITAKSADSPAVGGSNEKQMRAIITIIVGSLLLHVLTINIGILLFKQTHAAYRNSSYFTLLRTAWMKSNTDVQHYLDIAEHWYVNDGEERLFIVFFPLFPLMVRGLNLIIGNSYVSAQVINTVASSLTAGITYLTLLPDLGRKRSVCGAFIIQILPGAIFMNSPMSEPLFMLFSVCVFYFLNRKKLLIAGIFAALAGATRSLGVLLAVPIAYVGIGEISNRIRNGKPWKKSAVIALLSLVLSVFGTLWYLEINYSVHGDPFKFLEYQCSNWHQKASPFFDTARYMLNRATDIKPDNINTIISLWLPQLTAIFGSLFLIGLYAKRIPASQLTLFFPYFIAAIGCTWLLSAVRYLAALLPITTALASVCDKPKKTIPLFVLLSMLYIGYMLLYMKRMSIY